MVEVQGLHIHPISIAEYSERVKFQLVNKRLPYFVLLIERKTYQCLYQHLINARRRERRFCNGLMHRVSLCILRKALM